MEKMRDNHLNGVDESDIKIINVNKILNELIS